MSDRGVPPTWPPIMQMPPVEDAVPEPPKKRRITFSTTPKQRYFAVGLLIAALVAALIFTNVRIGSRPALSSAAVEKIANNASSNAVKALQAQPPTATTVYNEVASGLVLIQSKLPKKGEDLGTGFIIDKAGSIMTALHVVKGATAIDITFSNGMKSTATIASSDPDHDIAVLTANTPTTSYTPETLGGTPQIGADVFAVGNPLGLVGSLSAGVVSGLNRSFPVPHGGTLTGMIQFDAAVNPGNSGGPLLNAKGQVIGVVTGLVNPTGADSFAGIAFAVPIATAGGAAGEPAK